MTANENGARELHKKLATELFNRTWDLLDKADRTPQVEDTMIHAAHASRYHWGEIGTPLEFARGEWQISRVYAVLKRPEGALYHAQRSLALCQENGIGDFDLAFGYEGVSRAYAVAGDTDKSLEFFDLALEAARAIEDQGNREYVEGELATISECGESCAI
jgi:tetratricopeptide (TPR) repeat protein